MCAGWAERDFNNPSSGGARQRDIICQSQSATGRGSIAAQQSATHQWTRGCDVDWAANQARAAEYSVGGYQYPAVARPRAAGVINQERASVDERASGVVVRAAEHERTGPGFCKSAAAGNG